MLELAQSILLDGSFDDDDLDEQNCMSIFRAVDEEVDYTTSVVASI